MKKIALYFLVVGFLSSCSFKELQFKDPQVTKFNAKTDRKVGVEFKFNIYNPNPYKVKLKRMDLRAMINNVEVAKIGIDRPLVLGRKKETAQDFVAEADLSSLLASAPLILLQGKANLQVQGVIKGRALLIFSKKYKVSLEKEVSLKGLKL